MQIYKKKRCIITPTYINHFNQFEIYLKSFGKFVFIKLLPNQILFNIEKNIDNNIKKNNFIFLNKLLQRILKKIKKY